jgi:hypothetical protein
MLGYDVAVVGRLDSVLRAMEFESLQPGKPEDPDEDVWTQDIHASWSRLWILAAYECVRTAAQRATGDRSAFKHLRDRMGLVRIPLAKAEIAKDKKYLGNSVLNLGRVGDPSDAPPIEYRAGGAVPYLPSHIWNTETGSIGWIVIDLSTMAEVLILRCQISDELLAVAEAA